MARQLFGTDGIRGVAGEKPLDDATVYAVGAALGKWAAEHSPHPQVVLGMDTRESGPQIAAKLAAGMREHGVEPRFAGLITTPGIAYLTRSEDFIAGVMISASHNPYHDNGIKVFDHSGYKLPDAQEEELEEQIFAVLRETRPLPQVPDLPVDEGLDERYLAFLASTVHTPLTGMKLVLDCAHGAASELGPRLFSRLGASVRAIGCQPTGTNINDGCGALHVEQLRQAVLQQGADAGVAFDGDADRAILVSKDGKIIDGDHVLLLVALAMHDQGKLPPDGDRPTVVATVMSNLGLERALNERGIGMVRTPVGDKYVLEEMVRRGAVLGGEQSGHVIFREFATTGDGLLTALRVLEVVRRAGQGLDELTASMRVYPQLLVNVKVKERKPLDQLPRVQQEIQMAEAAFGGEGRVLVRFSGTEPLARVMVEGREQEQVERFAHRIADSIRTELSS